MQEQKTKEPYLDRRYHPAKWIGQQPSHKNKHYPKCPRCHSSSSLFTPANMDIEGEYHPAIFECDNCNNHFEG